MTSSTDHMQAKTTTTQRAVANPAQGNPLDRVPLKVNTLAARSLLQRAAEDPLSLTRAEVLLLRSTASPATIQRLVNHPDVRQARRARVPAPAQPNKQVIQRMPVPRDMNSKEGKLYTTWKARVEDFNKDNGGFQFVMDVEWVKAPDIKEFMKNFNARKEKANTRRNQNEDTSASIPSNSILGYQPQSSTTKAKKKKKNNKPTNVASSYFVGGPATTQETVTMKKSANNALIQQWIANRPFGATITEGKISVSEDTVYLYATVNIPDNSQDYSQINQYDIETHYHPVPISQNYLHVKHSAASDAGNVVKPTCWLIPRGVDALEDAADLWDKAYPDEPAQRKWKT